MQTWSYLMKKSKFYALCILLAAGAGACESEVTWDGCADNACLGNMITCPDGTVVSKDGTCQCQPQNVHCHEGYLYMCGDIIDKTNDDTRIANAVFSCQNGCNKGNTGCETYPAEKIVDVSSDPQICDEHSQSGCLKEEKNTYLCINDKEVVYLDDKKVNFCQESSDAQPKQEYQPCTDNLSSTCKDDKLIMCDAISGMHFVVENCLNGCNEEEKKCNPAPENCVMSCENGELACWIEGIKVASYTCEFGCHENKNECNPISTKCENRSCDGKNIVCYLYSGTENEQQLILEECSDECDSEKIVCKEQIEQEEQSDSYLNQLLKECSEDPNKDSLENLKLALNGEVVVDAQYFGKCDLKNSILLGVNENNIETVITVKTSSDQPVAPDALFKSIENSTIANIKFKYDVEYKGSVETSSDPDDPQNPEPKDETTSPKGMLAHEIKDSTLSNLALKGNLNIIAMQSESQIGSLAGVVSQTKMEDMTFTGSIVLSKDNDGQELINVSNVGGLIGECQGGCEISKVNITADGENLIQMELLLQNELNSLEDKVPSVPSCDEEEANYPIKNEPHVENIGGLIGYVYGENPKLLSGDSIDSSGKNNVKGDISIYAQKHYVNHVGGLFGQIQTSDEIKSANYQGNISIDVMVSAYIGGLIGGAEKIKMKDINVCNEDDCTLNIHTRDIFCISSDSAKMASAYGIGGVIGRISTSEVNNLLGHMNMELTGYYHNRIGGAFGALYNSHSNNVNVGKKDKSISITLNSGSDDYIMHGYSIGGVIGKSAGKNNTPYHFNNVMAYVKLNMKGGNYQNVSYIGGVLGLSSGMVMNSNLEDKSTSDIEFDWGSENIVNGPNQIGGFAGLLSYAKIKNVNHTLINNSQICGDKHVGGFAGYIKGESDSKNTEITNVSSTVHTVSGHKRVGGFIGTADGKYTISNVNNKVDTVKILGGKCADGEDSCTYTGGFVSYITKSTNGDITAKFEKILNRVNVMKIEGGEDVDIDAMGGFAGHIQSQKDKLTLELKQIQSFAELNLNNKVDGNSYGGFVGYIHNDNKLSKINVSNVFSWGNVKNVADNVTHVGGFIAHIGNENDQRTELKNIVTVGNVYTDEDKMLNHSIVFGQTVSELFKREYFLANDDKNCSDGEKARCNIIERIRSMENVYFGVQNNDTYEDDNTCNMNKNEMCEKEDKCKKRNDFDSPFYESNYLCYFADGDDDWERVNVNKSLRPLKSFQEKSYYDGVIKTLNGSDSNIPWSVQNICNDTFETSDTIENCKNGGITVPVVKAYKEVSVKPE